MEGLRIEAIYENGALKLPRHLPLVEGAAVTITIHPPGRPGVVKHLQVPSQTDPEELDRWLNDPDEGQWGARDS
jgi:predicted DNA-binding antitoxin AbrB/MazE fold protein